MGVLFILCSAAAILSIVPLGASVGAPVDFAKLAGSDNAVVTTALIEDVFNLIGTLSLLALPTVSQQAAASVAPSSFQATGDALVAVREWAPGFVAGLAFVVGTFMYNCVMQRSRLVPRWLSGWGLVGALLSLVAYLYAGFTQDFGFTTVNDVLSAPIGRQEMVLAVWLIAKGFNLSAVRSIAPSTVRSTTA